MRLSQIPFKTSKTVSQELGSKNARLLTQAAYIHQEIAGVYSFLPLGLRVLNKIENIIREEMDKIGSEILMTALAPLSIWEKTGRAETVDVLMRAVPANAAALAKNDSEYILGSTHEEMVTPIMMKFNKSYKDFPFATYQIQSKFRNEPRAKSGLLRCREFRMKDLYSFHNSEEDLKRYYEVAKEAYWNVFKRLGFTNKDTFVTLASGGDFTKDYSHEFQTICDAGEDEVYFDPEKNIAYNKEIATDTDAKKLGVDFSKLKKYKTAEIGNIFPLNTKFSKSFGYKYTDENGKENDVYMGCYGIGSSRIMGVLVEKFADEKGLVWPTNVAPFQAILVDLTKDDSGQARMTGRSIYKQLQDAGIEVLWDDRKNVSAGEKFGDADLLGIPYRLVISQKTLQQSSGQADGKIELKKRNEKETELLSIDEIIKRLKQSA